MPHTNPGPTDRESPQPDQPTGSTGRNLAYLHPDTLRIGGVGVFAGDRAGDPPTDGRPARIPVGFLGVLTARRGSLAEFTCTREVAQAIVADQHRIRDRDRARLATRLTGARLHTAVDQAAAPMWFDGGDLIVDERAVRGDPDGLRRVGPDPDGRYSIGWGWTWRPVDPAGCDRIVGQIPPQGRHQQFVTLVHTPDLRLPHNRLAISSLRQMPTHNGVAFVADLTIDGRYAGPIENNGNGGATEYFGLNSSPFTWKDLHHYVQACRYRGQPVDEEFILEALIGEYEFDREVAAAARTGATLVRLLDDHGYTLHTRTVRPAPTSGRERAALARRLAASPPAHRAGRLWQIWDGTAWAHLANVGSNTSDTASGQDPP